jgi:hypothetical protein
VRVDTSVPGHHPVPAALLHVHCQCGFGADTTATTVESAIAEVSERHRCKEPAFTAEGYTCDDCDAPLPLNKRIMGQNHGMTWAICRACAKKYRGKQ